VLVHADEACLGNGQEPPTPGGCGGLVEVVRRGPGAPPDARSPAPQGNLWDVPPVAPDGSVERLDYYLSEPDTTNNRMALSSEIAALDLLSGREGARAVAFVSDSSYLVLGMTQWVPAWRARGWRRKGGAIENLDLWQDLVRRASLFCVEWRWVRGHSGHPKNEYANHLATRAAARQELSGGLVPSGFGTWLEEERAKARYPGYDPDADLRFAR